MIFPHFSGMPNSEVPCRTPGVEHINEELSFTFSKTL